MLNILGSLESAGNWKPGSYRSLEVYFWWHPEYRSKIKKEVVGKIINTLFQNCRLRRIKTYINQ
jgi:hypothetical protein